MNKAKIAVIIATFNRSSYLETLLNQLFSQKDIDHINLIPVIVIDGSTDGTKEMLINKFSGVKILNGPGDWWWTKSVNEGIKFSIKNHNPDYILLLNDDSQVESDYISSLFNEIKIAGDNSIIGSISVTDKEPARISFSGVKKTDWVKLKSYHYHKGFEYLKNVPSSGLFPTYALNGRGTIANVAVFNELNYLDEVAFPQYHSDDDFALRAWKKGHNVFVSYACKIIDRTHDTSAGTAFRQDGFIIFFKSFFKWTSVNYIPKQLLFFYRHGIKILIPFYLLKFLLGTSYAYFIKYKKLKHEL